MISPIFVLVGPPSDGVRASSELAAVIDQAESKLLAVASETPGIYAVGSAELLRRYPVADYSDQYSYEVSHIPYEPELFVALATMLVRRIFTARQWAPEVVVLDCDTTFWERNAGTTQAKAELPSTQLQEFMTSLEEAGMILCLVGSESEAEVSAKFDQTPGMKLGWQHVASSRFGVRAKSDGLRSL